MPLSLPWRARIFFWGSCRLQHKVERKCRQLLTQTFMCNWEAKSQAERQRWQTGQKPCESLQPSQELQAAACSVKNFCIFPFSKSDISTGAGWGGRGHRRIKGVGRFPSGGKDAWKPGDRSHVTRALAAAVFPIVVWHLFLVRFRRFHFHKGCY